MLNIRLVSAGITILPRSSIFLVIPESMEGWEPTVPGMTWVDTHCHLQLDGRDPGELLERAPEVGWVVVPGVDLASSRQAVVLAERFPQRVLATTGLHPHDAEQWPAQREAIEEMVSSVAAVGETGLDFYRMLSPVEAQVEAFVAHLDLAVRYDKPVVVHCRDAFARVHEILESTGAGPRAVLHSWTGGTRWTRRFLELGVMFSFSGTLAFDTAETIRLGARLVPMDRAMVETDTPYLAPPPHRGEKNEPAWVALVGEALASVWGVGIEEAAAATTANASGVFRR
jgi:TatD DNase family protein